MSRVGGTAGLGTTALCVTVKVSITDPVQNIRPALSGDALVYREHGKSQIVKVGNAIIWPGPTTPTFGSI